MIKYISSSCLQEKTLPNTQKKQIILGNLNRKPPQCGYSSCSRCSCRGFEGNGYCCTNCGHNYSDHY